MSTAVRVGMFTDAGLTRRRRCMCRWRPSPTLRDTAAKDGAPASIRGSRTLASGTMSGQSFGRGRIEHLSRDRVLRVEAQGILEKFACGSELALGLAHAGEQDQIVRSAVASDQALGFGSGHDQRFFWYCKTPARCLIFHLLTYEQAKRIFLCLKHQSKFALALRNLCIAQQ